MTHNHHSAPSTSFVPSQRPFWHYIRTQWGRAFGLNVSKINELLFVGGEFRALQWPRLQALGIRAVLSLQAERVDEFAGTRPVRTLRLPVADFHPPSIPQLHEAMAFINAAHADQLPVFIHCHAGVGRASLTASAFLMTQGHNANTAFAHIRAARPIVRLNGMQRARLLEWERVLQQSAAHAA